MYPIHARDADHSAGIAWRVVRSTGRTSLRTGRIPTRVGGTSLRARRIPPVDRTRRPTAYHQARLTRTLDEVGLELYTADDEGEATHISNPPRDILPRRQLLRGQEELGDGRLYIGRQHPLQIRSHVKEMSIVESNSRSHTS